MKVIIKLTVYDEDLNTGKEYEADKLPNGYFVRGEEVSKLIPHDHAVELNVVYSK